MRKRMLSVAVWGVAAVLASAPAGAQGPRSDAGGTLAGAGVQRPRPASSHARDVADGPPAFGVPVEVREIKGDGRAPQAVVVNTGSRDIHVFELAVYRPGLDGTWEFLGSSGQSGITGWHPGEERRTSAAGWRPDDGSVLVPTLAFFDDGTAVGKREAIEHARSGARESRAALEALVEAFDAFPDPVGGDQLQLLIDQIALAFARAPFTPDGRGRHQFLNTMNELKLLMSPSRPRGTSIEDGVSAARNRLAIALDVQRRLPVLLKDAPVKTSAAVP